MTVKSHILVVEDDPLVSEVIAAALDETYLTTVAPTAAEALTHLRDSPVSLVLLDCTLPGGVDAALIPEADRIGAPVILMSGDKARIDGLLDEPRPFVLKPFSLMTLLEAVERAMGGPAASNSATAR